MSFEEYLVSKKIDQHAFEFAEPSLYKNWKVEFEQMHPNSFTLQKLNLINPLRRKYILKSEPLTVKVEKSPEEIKSANSAIIEPGNLSSQPSPLVPQAVKPSRPVFKPKMK